jgi:hypothetical protein
MSCSLLTPWFCSRNYFSCGYVICGISYLCSLGYFSCGDVIYGITIVCLIAWTIDGIAFTTIGTIDGSTLPFIIFYALKFVLSCSFFILKPKAPPSSTLLFLLKALLGEFVATFFVFFSVVYIYSLVLLTLADGFFGLSF